VRPRELESGTGSKSPHSGSFRPMLRVPARLDRRRAGGCRHCRTGTGLSHLGCSFGGFLSLRSLPLLVRCSRRLHQLQNQFSSLDVTCRKGAWEVSHLGFRVAWSEPGGHLCHFDAQYPRVLDTETLADFASYLGQVRSYRTFPSPNPRHFFYRYRQERWLESLVIREHRRLNALFREVSTLRCLAIWTVKGRYSTC